MPENEQIKDQLISVLDEYFKQDRKFIDASRIPLICQDIKTIHTSLGEIKTILEEKVVTQDQFWPVKSIVYGFTTLALTAVAGALIALVIKN
jgi:hypothetical protein